MTKVKIINKSGVNLHGVPPGGESQIEVDKQGTPLDKEWRRRFKDAKLDNCVEVVKEIKQKKSTKEEI